jgi:SAM-dependent methyltransferase
VDEPAYLDIIRATYDAMADLYAERLPDLRAETPLDQAMLGTFAQLCRNADLGPVADLGCGTGRISAHLANLGVDVVGIDLSPAMIDHARLLHPNLSFHVGSMVDVDLPDAAVSGVVAWYSTIHTPPQDMPTVFAEFSRVLAPGGRLLVGFHVGDKQPRTVTYREGVSVKSYDVTPQRMADLCREAGFEVHTELLRAPEGREQRPQASLIALRA